MVPKVRESQWRKWFDGPYLPRRVETVASRGRGIQEARRDAAAEEAMEFRGAYVAGLMGSDEE